MRIVIDLQGAQCENRKRGIGRYSMAMAQALVRNRGAHEVLVALNGNFPATIEPIRAAFDGLLPQEKIRVWQVPAPVRHLDAANQWRRKAAELVREAFLASLQPDMVYVTSLFEGLVDDAVSSIGVFSRSIPVAVTLYDLIPLIYRSPYLDNPQVESWYESKLDHLRRADLLLAISKSSQHEAVDFLAFPPDRSVYVGTAADPQFKPVVVSGDAEQRLRAEYGLPREFVMYTGGIDPRKNIEGLIRAFALLPQSLRQQHQLAVICAVEPASRSLLKALCQEKGLADSEVVLTGFVPEEDLIALYSLCKAFIFPSWHEGFGLPALEAMCCGAPVIAANTSSLPEVIGREDALFNPRSDEAIARKLSQVLTDDVFRAELAAHGLEQAKKFSWDASATSALTAFEQFHLAQTNRIAEFHAPSHRPKMAYISPLPPARSGIADYSAELLPELARFYEIEVIAYGQPLANPWVKENCKQRTVEWFEQHPGHYQRVLYHFGNSDHHQHMFDLLEKIPGVVMLHDFFLSGIVAHMDVHGFNPGTWTCELYDSYGYAALQERFHAKDTADVVWKYPCNKTVVDNALGVIVHSDYSRRLADKWLAPSTAQTWSVIPLLRVPAHKEDRLESRTLLGLGEDAFIFCSFGMLGRSKSNQRLLDAWIKSPLSRNENCRLIFVGQNHADDYGSKLVSTINDHGLSGSVSITGWVSTADYHHYLAAANVGIQLRTLSRGETSAAVLDCMNYGLPTIVNANGSMADLPADSVWMLDDNFDDADLQKAMEALYESETKRAALETRARDVILTTHSPRFCAEQYVESIENCYEQAQNSNWGLIQEIAKFDEPNEGGSEALLELAKAITQNQPPPCRRQLLVDISELVQQDSKSGIQRVVRSVLLALLSDPPEGFRVEPVYAVPNQPGYRYARQFTLRFLNCPDQALSDDAVDVFNGDIFLGLDLQLQVIPQQAEFYAQLKRIGVQVYFVVYDLLPVQASQFFVPEANALFTGWLNTIAEADGLMCISRSTADDLLEWLGGSTIKRSRPLKIGWFHLGANVAESVPSVGVPEEAPELLQRLASQSTFLMVGTIEPRKGKIQTLHAFEKLWAKEIDVNLVIVGKQGWMVEALIEEIRHHPENGKRLFWLSGISDEYLEKLYAASSCLISASSGEGFGLPLIEAADHKIPILARDIPVFREVAGSNAYYFDGETPDALAEAVQAWLVLNELGKVPQSAAIPRLTWKQSTKNLLDVLLSGSFYREWMDDGSLHYRGSDHRLNTQVGKRTGRTIASTGKAGFLLFGPYAPLGAGPYRARLHVTVGSNDCTGSYADVVMNKGEQVLGTAAVNGPAQGEELLEMFFSVATPCSDFEVRLWVTEQSDLTVSRVEIEPCQDTSIAGGRDASPKRKAPLLVFSEQASSPIPSVPPALKKDRSPGRSKQKHHKK